MLRAVGIIVVVNCVHSIVINLHNTFNFRLIFYRAFKTYFFPEATIALSNIKARINARDECIEGSISIGKVCSAWEVRPKAGQDPGWRP